jgi:hypothetical protein
VVRNVGRIVQPICFVVPEDADIRSEDPATAVLQSERVVRELLPQEGPIYSFDLKFPMVVNSEGDCVVIVALEMISLNVANALQWITLTSNQVLAEIVWLIAALPTVISGLV